MSKYDYDEVAAYQESRRQSFLIPGEHVLWSAKPKKNAFVANKILGMMPIALLWLAFDGFFIANMIGSDMGGMGIFMIFFFALHLMPVWIWLSNVLTANRRWKNTMYYVTDKRVLIQTGFLSADLQTIYYKDIRNIDLRIGLADKLLGVGDVHFDLGLYTSKGKARTKAFLDIENPHEAYTRIQSIVLNIQTDMEYPNAYRPEENPGYNTQYRG